MVCLHSLYRIATVSWQKMYHIISWEKRMLKSVMKCGSYCHFSYRTRYHKIHKNNFTTVRRYVRELAIPRTMGHLIEKKYQGTSHHFCTNYMHRTAFLASLQWWYKTLWMVIKTHLDSTAIMLVWVWSHIFDNDWVILVRFSSLIYQTNCICTGFHRILYMFTYVASSSGRHTNYHNQITGMKFRQSKITKSFLQPTITT